MGALNSFENMFCLLPVIYLLDDHSIDLVTCLVVLHQIPHLESMLREIVRILRPSGYLIMREHDCEGNGKGLQAKCINFNYAILMIAEVGEFKTSVNQMVWEEKKSQIIKYTKSMQYRSRKEWRKELENVGFVFKATVEYSGFNPQALFYGIYQLPAEKTSLVDTEHCV